MIANAAEVMRSNFFKIAAECMVLVTKLSEVVTKLPLVSNVFITCSRFKNGVES
jgi:hypothetical protein